MSDRYPPINPKCPHFLHGGDYNPDQWQHMPEVLDEDMRLMKLAHCNAMSVGIFAWTALEPREGEYTFDWLDATMDRLADNGGYAVLATPTGAKPAWMSAKYPEIRRVHPDGVTRDPHAGRHNHCYTSPVYREKAQAINRKLAERYKDHPALLLWHLSNEYGGECHCNLCFAAFRKWLKEKYGDLDTLNRAWWTAFWSHTFTEWEQIDFIDHGVHCMALDWKRFVTHQTTDFMKHELAPLREITPGVPATTNMMGLYPGLDYWKMAPHIDVISWDNYPQFHNREGDWKIMASIGFAHDINRCMKGGKPFMLMESTPSSTNWMPVSKLKKPGMHKLMSLQAVAHGSDTVQYFQWRKSRGCSEKFHGAVVDHCGHEHTRVFQDVADLGRALEQLDPVIGTTVRPEVAIIYDWENRWAIEAAAGPRREGRDYPGTCTRHYTAFWKRGIPADVINADVDFSGYRVVVAPMLYMLRKGMGKRIADFVRAGGVFVTTYWSGIVDEHDLCHLGGWPGAELREVLGVWDEEIDVLYDDEQNRVLPAEDNRLGLNGEYAAGIFCNLIHAESADVLATYGDDFYAGRPALTVNRYGEGEAYYIASRNDDRFLDNFYQGLVIDLSLKRILDTDLPEGVTAQMRTDGDKEYVFLMNFTDKAQDVDLAEAAFTDMLSKAGLSGRVTLEPFDVRVLQRG